MGFLLGAGLLVAGLILMVFAGFLFFTIILIPLAIIAGIIGVIMLIAGLVAAVARTTYHGYYHNAYSGEGRARYSAEQQTAALILCLAVFYNIIG